jgi:hypothetical protein
MLPPASRHAHAAFDSCLPRQLAFAGHFRLTARLYAGDCLYATILVDAAEDFDAAALRHDVDRAIFAFRQFATPAALFSRRATLLSMPAFAAEILLIITQASPAASAHYADFSPRRQ